MRKLGLFSLTCFTAGIGSTTFSVIAVVLLCPWTSFAQSTARTVARPLDQLVNESATIVRGHVISARIEPHPQLQNLTTVLVSMSITDTYKGQPQKILIFRQYVWNVDPAESSSEYRKGQELILLLRTPSEYGLTSPVGLEQGRFVVTTRAATGLKFAVNGHGNLGLFDHVAEKLLARGAKLPPRTANSVSRNRPGPGPVPVQELEDVIRALAGSE